MLEVLRFRQSRQASHSLYSQIFSCASLVPPAHKTLFGTPDPNTSYRILIVGAGVSKRCLPFEPNNRKDPGNPLRSWV